MFKIILRLTVRLDKYMKYNLFIIPEYKSETER